MTRVVSAGLGRRRAIAIPQLALIALAAVAWIWTIRSAQRMGNGPGTMGLGWDDFVGVWAVMMAAMMLPTVSHELPIAARRRLARALGFAIGYLSVWATLGISAYCAAAAAARLARHDPRLATAVAALTFATCGLYQFSSAKRAALDRCWPGTKDPDVTPDESVRATLRRGVDQARWCVASSWAMMAALIAFGVMNVTAMIAIFLAMYVERRQPSSESVRRLIGLASLVIAAVSLIDPQLAAGLHISTAHMAM